MTKGLQHPTIDLIPESAPFSSEQRAWLNGFFAAYLDLNNANITPLSPEEGAAVMAGVAAPIGNVDDDDTPWHDPALTLPERMKLAEGRPMRQRLMAAMAQQDCGQCGYNCRDYSNALAHKQEVRLNLCVPGGKETARMLKKLAEEFETPATTAPAVAPVPVPQSAPLGRARENPVAATFRSRTRLNKPGSEKETWHIEFDLADTELDYAVGDSFGLYPTNDPVLVDTVMRTIGARPDVAIGGRPLREVLIDSVALAPAPDTLFQLLSYLTGGARRQKAKALAAGEDPDGDAQTLDVLAAIEKFPGVRPDPEAFVEALEPLQPRLYSISSSIRTNPGRVSLTVDAVRYAVGKHRRLGVASTFLADRIKPSDRVRVYVQRAHEFSLPADPAKPIIMIGPGTGVAPFRAFLHERMATRAPGRNWLFFGHQRRDYDFFYEDEFSGLKASGVLTRLSLAWSRDGKEKFYVQDRMREVGTELWSWIADGAHIYVCGDAKRMAKDVEGALIDIVAHHGVRTTDQAIAFIADLKRQGRYQRDVY
jgi:sulfite reductase (NADPH) flavoprotein alpha-component